MSQTIGYMAITNNLISIYLSEKSPILSSDEYKLIDSDLPV